MFPGFTRALIPTPEAAICVRHGGSGPPVLLLHGHPQTHVMWHLTAPALAAEYTVVCADLRGYGDSGKPPAAPDHESYSKRAMARDMVAVMGALGHPEFAVVGHDRGGRVAYRLALDHPERVRGVAVLDIVPTGEMFRRADMAFGLGSWHWFFLAQGRWYDMLAVWRDWAGDVSGEALDCGHYLAEEAPEATLAALRPFLRRISSGDGTEPAGQGISARRYP